MINELSIASQSDVSDEEWIEICKKVPYSTFFHTPLWADIFCNNFKKRYKKAAKKIRFNDGKTVLFPCVTKEKTRFVKVTLSMPAATFGGWLSLEPLQVEHVNLLFQNLAQYKDLIMRENPYDPVLNSICIQNAKEDTTQSIYLDDGYEKIFQKSEYRHRRAVKTALKKGVVVNEATDFEQWSKYYDIYLKTIERWKKKRLFSGVSYKKSFFDLIYNLDFNNRKLFIAYVENKPVAGMLCFYWNNHAVMWHGAGLSDYFIYRPNNLLYDHAIHHACNNGFKWFDCNPSGGINGVIRFKKHLGAQFLQSRVIEHRTLVRAFTGSIQKIMS